MRARAVATSAWLGLALGLATATTARAQAPGPSAAPADPAISFTRTELPNGLTVLLHEDHTQPLVVVSLQVHVGSRDEKPGRTGFAHLFEHLMFMGTERVPVKKFDDWMELEGGANNAQTSQDWTRYYDVAPSHALPLLLWMEADRLEALGAQIDAAKLEVQRGVVRNERRDSYENEPYARADLRLPELLFPLGHPYHFDVIGSHADLVAAGVADVREFFARWYVPQNTSLVVGGDVDPATVHALVARYFGGLPGGSVPVRAPAPPPARLGGVVRETLPDAVTLPKIIMAWPSPARFAPGDAELSLAASVLGSGKNSRLYRELVYGQKLAQSVRAYQMSLELGSFFAIEVVAQPPDEGETLEGRLARVEQAIDRELARLAAEAPSAEELGRAEVGVEMGFVSGLQSLLGRVLTLNDYQQSRGDPGYLARDLARFRAATAEAVRAAAADTLHLDRRVILRVVPKAEDQAPGATP
ncbi:MAG: insulinase family protein [Polyangiaceae bacterium]|nr:insulinase family protein [Polyangiaceae bacterium]